MSPRNRPKSQDGQSFIEAARRAQIVECAIDTIAEVGYARASMEQIAKRAGISRGLISYHFAGKDELIAQVLITVYSEGGAFMAPRVEAEPTAAGQLRAYIESNLDYMRAYPNRMVAVVEILGGGVLASGLPGIDLDAAEEQSLGPVEAAFRRGQADGEFRGFDPRVMARALRNVIDGIPPRISVEPDLDLDAYARELTTMFDLATRNPEREPGQPGTPREPTSEEAS